MDIKTRALTDKDKERAVWIESGAIKGLSYIGDVWEQFSDKRYGEFTGAFLNGELGGVGKLTEITKGFGWLEALRVHPDYQRKGLGNAIYARYAEQMEEMGLKAVGMYTGYTNAASKALAEKNGLTVQSRFSEYMVKSAQIPADSGGFIPVQPSCGEIVLSPYYNGMMGFLAVNRTFYPVKEGLGSRFAENGWFYKDYDGNIALCGFRFQPFRAIHFPYYHGDFYKALAFVSHMAKKIGAEYISSMIPFDDELRGNELQEQGFAKGASDFITLWKGL